MSARSLAASSMSLRVGVLNALPSVQLCELLGRIGYGFVVLDLEHMLRAPDELEHAIRACELSGCEAWCGCRRWTRN